MENHSYNFVLNLKGPSDEDVADLLVLTIDLRRKAKPEVAAKEFSSSLSAGVLTRQAGLISSSFRFDSVIYREQAYSGSLAPRATVRGMDLRDSLGVGQRRRFNYPDKLHSRMILDGIVEPVILAESENHTRAESDTGQRLVKSGARRHLAGQVENEYFSKDQITQRYPGGYAWLSRVLSFFF